MRLNDGGIILIITIVTIAGVIGYLSSRLGGMKDDNAIEEFCEDVLEDQVGLSVDLTPSSPEK